ncbi:hypothetical protein GW17_00059000 [Ensete ventricosum]|nr:hypothetical protein GW17_00059000 [Ensete ventricosum]
MSPAFFHRLLPLPTTCDYRHCQLPATAAALFLPPLPAAAYTAPFALLTLPACRSNAVVSARPVLPSHPCHPCYRIFLPRCSLASCCPCLPSLPSSSTIVAITKPSSAFSSHGRLFLRRPPLFLYSLPLLPSVGPRCSPVVAALVGPCCFLLFLATISLPSLVAHTKSCRHSPAASSSPPANPHLLPSATTTSTTATFILLLPPSQVPATASIFLSSHCSLHRQSHCDQVRPHLQHKLMPLTR